jgi:ribA/ribD-fused uncharacterized protein
MDIFFSLFFVMHRFAILRYPAQLTTPYAPQSIRATSLMGILFFWRADASEGGYLSQWTPSTFTDGRHTFANTEQYMMYRKAILFVGDDDNHEVVRAILREHNPANLQKLGRLVPGFEQAVWDHRKYNIVVDGNMLRFAKNADLRRRLIETGNRELVEASPKDRIWGIGYNASAAPKVSRSRWGENLLGKALMEVRQALAEEARDDGE